MRTLRFTGVYLAAVATLPSIASAQSYALRAVVLDGGGARLMSSSYNCGLSAGQPMASGVLTAGPCHAALGFWHQLRPAGGIAEEVGQATHRLSFQVGQNVPNPFRRQTAIRYALSQETSVALRVYNSVGRVVTTLVSGTQKPGRYAVSWDVSRVPAAKLPCGTYFCRLEAGEFTATRKMVKTE